MAYKRNVTSKKVQKFLNENTNESIRLKELLLELAQFSTILGEKIDASNVKRLISLSKKWNVNLPGNVSRIQDFQKLKDNAKFDLMGFINYEASILADFDFFDIQSDLKKIFERYKNDLLEIRPTAEKSELYDIKYSSKDYGKQFTDVRNREPAEIYANLMYLSNQLAHIFSSENRSIKDKGNKEYNEQIYFLRRAFMNIKDWCVHQIIQEKKNGANIETICVQRDETKYGFVFSVILPDYFEPFRVHIPDNLLSPDEMSECSSQEQFFDNNLKTTFPTYVSEEKFKLLEEVYREKYKGTGNRYGESKSRLQWFLSNRSKLLKQQKEKDIKDKKLELQTDNKSVLDEISEGLNISFPQYFEEGFLNRTSYSLRDALQEIKNIAEVELLQLGVPVGSISTEVSKLFIYMKMVTPLSTFRKMSEQDRRKLVLDSIQKYEQVYAFVSENMGIFDSYSELKSKMKKGDFTVDESKRTRVAKNEEHAILIEDVRRLSEEVQRLSAQLVEWREKYSNAQKQMHTLNEENRKLRTKNKRLARKMDVLLDGNKRLIADRDKAREELSSIRRILGGEEK